MLMALEPVCHYGHTMAEYVYPPVIAAARTMFAALGLKIDIQGAANVPTSGPAVLASNHIGYLDFIFAGLGAHESKRLVRFMAKESIFRHKIGGPLMRGMHHIPVDRDAGSQSFRDALGALKSGEVVGIFPEATISESYDLKAFKSGAERLAAASGAPLIPVVIWGSQRIWTKGRPKDWTRGRAISISVGEPLLVGRKDDPEEVTAELRSRMSSLLEAAVERYPDSPVGQWWAPVRFGGTATA